MADSARDIENLLYTYAERIDAGDLDGVAELFTHATIFGQENGPPETQFVGKEGAAKMYGSQGLSSRQGSNVTYVSYARWG